MKYYLILTVLMAASQVFAQESVIQRFVNGQTAAASTMQNLDFTEIDHLNLPQDLKVWLILNKQDLAMDIRTSSHKWNVGNFQMCAFTQVNSKAADIQLSIDECTRETSSIIDAAYILAVQSIFHLGITDENSARLLANVVYVGAPTPLPVPPPAPVPTTDVFDSNICQGPLMTKADMLTYFKPGTSSTDPFGNYKGFARYRICNLQTGCGTWTGSEELTDGNYVQISGWHIKLDIKNQIIEVNLQPKEAANGNISIVNSTGSTNYVYSSNGYYYYEAIYAFPKLFNFKAEVFEMAFLRKNCGYLKTTHSTKPDSSDSYYDYEVVVFGTH